MIRINNTRFGEVEVEDGTLIEFDQGLIGFPDEKLFVLLECDNNDCVGHLQSVATPWLAFPVMDAALLAPAYPDPQPEVIADRAGLGNRDVAMLIILSNNDQEKRVEANLVAPLVVDLATRKGAQVTLDPYRYTARFQLAPTVVENDEDSPKRSSGAAA